MIGNAHPKILHLTPILCVLLLWAGRPSASHATQQGQGTMQETLLSTRFDGRPSHAASRALNRTMDLRMNQVSILTALHTIAEEAGLTLSYSKSDLLDRPLSLHLKKTTVRRAITRVLEGTGLGFAVSPNGHLVITPAAHTVQTGSIAGTITGAASGEPLPGANVLVLNTSRGTSADADGSYRISDLEEGAYTLRYTFIGFQDVERRVVVQANQTTTVDVSMESKSSVMDNLVVLGYGSVQRKDLTGSVSSVSGEEIQSASATSFEEALGGRAAGVFVRQGSGEPGAGAQINVRGLISVFGFNQPLYVIDGVPVLTNQNFSENYDGILNAESENPLAAINPSDIKSIEILKDASATAIYGSRAANGVVLITTKRGQENQNTQISFNYSMNTNTPIATYDMLSGSEYRQAMTTAATNYERDIAQKEDILNNPDSYFRDANTDWVDQVTRTSFTHDFNLRFAGGTESMIYSLSGNVRDEAGTYINSDYSRYNLRSNIEGSVHDRLRIGANANLTYSKRNGYQRISTMLDVLDFRPDFPVYDPSSEYGYSIYEGVQPNPLAQRQIDRTLDSYVLLGNIFGELNFTDRISFRSQLNVNFADDENRTFFPPYAGFLLSNVGPDNQGQLNQSSNRQIATTWDNTLNFNGTVINEYHTVDAVVGASWWKTRNQYDSFELRGFADYEQLNDPSSAGQIRNVNGQRTVSGLASYFGRMNYNFDDTYYVTFTGRADASSKYGPDNKWAYFPSGPSPGG